MILLSEYCAHLIPPSYDGLTMTLFSYCTEEINNNYGTICLSDFPLISTLRQSFSIGDWTTWGCRIIQLEIYFLTCLLILVWPYCLKMVDHYALPDIIDFRFGLEASNILTEVFCLTYNEFENWRSDFWYWYFISQR